MNLPHDWVAAGAAGLGVALFSYVGLVLARRVWEVHRARYLEGAAVTLDAMYLTVPPQMLLYLGLVAMLVAGALVTLLSGSAALGLVFAVPCFFLPRVALRLLKLRRDRLFNEQLVDALMNVSNSLRAGFSLPQAFELLRREMPDPMAQEIRLLTQELRLGVPMEEALENLRRRMPLADVELTVSAIVIVREVGGNLTEVFDNIARTIRERYRIEGKIRALTSMGRMQAVVMCLLPVALALAMTAVAPGFAQNLTGTTAGLGILAAVVVLEALAVLWIRKIIAIDV